MLTAFSIYVTLFISATLTGFLVLKKLEGVRKWELELEELRLASENFKRDNLLVKEKLVHFNIFLREMALDFSLIFLTIDCSAKMSQHDFYSKYRAKWAKVSEVQMIADFYAPPIRELAEELDKLTLCYWRYLYKVLVAEQNIDRSSPDYLEAEKYSQIVPAKINDIRQKIKEIAY